MVCGGIKLLGPCHGCTQHFYPFTFPYSSSAFLSMAKDKSSSRSGSSSSKPRKTAKKSSKSVSPTSSKSSLKAKPSRRGLYVRASRHFAAKKAQSVTVVDLSGDEGSSLDGPNVSSNDVPPPPPIEEPGSSQTHSLVEYGEGSSSDTESCSSDHRDGSALVGGGHNVSVSAAGSIAGSTSGLASDTPVPVTPGAAAAVGGEVHHSTPLATGVPPVQGSGVSPVTGPEHNAGITIEFI